VKTVVFMERDQYRLGVKTDRGILDVAKARERLKNGRNGAWNEVPDSVEELIEGGTTAVQALDALAGAAKEHPDLFLDEGKIRLGPCVTRPEKIVCVGLNYRAHAKESKMEPPKHPVLFSKFANALIGSGAPVKKPAVTEQLDYEAELAVVIGREARDVNPEEALDYVFGYCNANDLSARDLQFLTPQWLLGKTCDGFCPLGPYLVTKDEIPDPNRLDIQLRRNGRVVQKSNTSYLIFNVQYLISFISKHLTLKEGDVILTGTPEGVILGMEEGERDWLKPGDVLEVEIEGLGVLTNPIA